ncbi:DUF1292 domain-containing protein [Terrilactibacillus sp. BCM23-1]|uniref:UPF0473 protein GMB86_10630 n=1 Tax=Terrilactibacillus tamarindi TaxID=2599694 RepID=A0A6N8CS02_9BACI|nr:DUF1292 domain-containing protein [Terrilactibacillus tamarindi]MTT32460.1 DUF1292 domain-containing protein [Terrilactibacillus tamarindi]
MHEHHDHEHGHEEEQERIIIPDPDTGEDHLFDILFTFDVTETDKSYMVVTPVETDEEDDEQEVFGFRYEDNDGNFKLFPIETDAEWEMVEEMINTFSEEDE